VAIHHAESKGASLSALCSGSDLENKIHRLSLQWKKWAQSTQASHFPLTHQSRDIFSLRRLEQSQHLTDSEWKVELPAAYQLQVVAAPQPQRYRLWKNGRRVLFAQRTILIFPHSTQEKKAL
jgi:hypothetical protein